MNTICRFVIILILLYNVGNINAQNRDDHLEPVRGIFDVYDFQLEYYPRVRKVLFSGLSNKPEIRFLVMPSFTPEYVLDIEFDRKNNKYYMVYHICEQMIWKNPAWEKLRLVSSK